jgi:uncharacterized protein (TIGR03437 family)
VDHFQTVTIALTLVTSGFDVGTFQGLVTIASGDYAVFASITVNVTGIQIKTSPNAVAFTLVVGATSNANVVVTGVNGATGNVVVQKNSGGGWLSYTSSPNTGTLPITVTVLADSGGLAPGTYLGKLTVSCFSPTVCAPVEITASLTVIGLSSFSVNPSTIFFSTTSAAPAVQSSSVILSNSGADSPFAATVVNVPGVSINPTNGTIRGNQQTSLTVTADPTGINPGIYSGSIQFAGNGSMTTLAVKSTILGVGVTPSTVTLSALKGKQATATFQVTGTEAFTIQRASGGDWLTFSPPSGQAPQTITVTADATNLTEGLNQGSLTVSCGANCVNRTVSVQFTVIPFRVVSSADYKSGLAPGSIASAFAPGQPGITTVTQTGTLPLVTMIAGVSVTVVDSTSSQFQAPLFFVSPGQVNFLVPEGVASGPAKVTLSNFSGVYTSGTFNISAIAPALYTQDGTGTGPPAAFVRYFAADGTEKRVLASSCDTTPKCTPLPIDVQQGTAVFLELYGTGIRHYSSKGVTATIGGQVLTASYAGPQNQFPGLDQVDVQLNSSLAGKGAVTLTLNVDGVVTQPVNLVLQ